MLCSFLRILVDLWIHFQKYAYVLSCKMKRLIPLTCLYGKYEVTASSQLA